MESPDSGDDFLPLRTIRVTELNYDVTEPLMFEKFSSIGPILALHLHKHPMLQYCTGVAHVTYYRSADAQRAFDTLNSTLMLGEPMMLHWAVEDEDIFKYRVQSFFINNLHKDIDDEGVEALCATYGPILYCNVNRDSRGNSMETAYVHYKNSCKAKELIKCLDGTEVNGQKLAIQHIEPPQDVPFTNIYVKYLASDCDNVELYNMFRRFGLINSCIVMRTPDGMSKRFGFVNFEDAKSAKQAVEEMHLSRNSQLGKIHVMRADTKPALHENVRQLEKRTPLNYLFVDNIGEDITEAEVRQEFLEFKNLKGVKVVIRNKKKFAYVFYKNSKSTDESVKLMAEKINTFEPSTIKMVNRFELPSFFGQTCAVPIIARGSYSPASNLTWEIFFDIYIKPSCEPEKKWYVYQLCRAET